MNREIKFRAWNVDEMIYSIAVKDSFAFSHGEHLQVENGERNYTIMQFTGLLDKNGNEIYEGDILSQHFSTSFNSAGRLENKVLQEVKWDKAGFNISHPLRMDIYEVIGNIYENPELLKPL